MKNLVNHVQLIGRLGIDPEIIKLPNGNSLVRMTLATNDYRKDKEGNVQQETQWHTLKAWGKLGEVMADKLSKGARVIIGGKLEHRSWETNQGEKRRSTEINVREFSLMNNSSKSAKEQPKNEVEKEMPF
jgi:single-strand DNA-binding protein